MTLVAPDHIESGTGRLLARVTAAEQHAISGKYAFAAGDLVYSKIRPYLRKAILADFDGLCSADMYPLRAAPDSSARFVLACLLGHDFSSYAESVSVRSGMPKINRAELADYSLVVPSSKVEQEAIASVLRDADALIESLEQLLAKKRQLKQGAMQELLTGKKRLPGFGAQWSQRPFGEVLLRVNAKANQIQTGAYQVTGRLPVVDQGQTKVVAYSDDADRAFRCPAGGVIVFGDHTCIVKYIDFDFLVGADGTQVLLARSGHSTRFHAYALEYQGVPSTGYSRHFKHLVERVYLTPSFEEQSAIATVLSTFDAELEALETRLAKARALKQGMAQALLTGRIRLAPFGN